MSTVSVLERPEMWMRFLVVYEFLKFRMLYIGVPANQLLTYFAALVIRYWLRVSCGTIAVAQYKMACWPSLK